MPSSPSDPSSAPPSGPWQAPGVEQLQRMLPQYEIVEILGRGGMGAVYKARQRSLERVVAIKILPPGLDDEDARFAERFRNEARALARMNHPGIVSVHENGEAGGLMYFVMEFVDGTDVGKLIEKQGRLPTEHALTIVAHVCDALHYAHSRGVVHRDIKPSNVMIDNHGRIKVADFGLAKMPNLDGGDRTRSAVVMGSPDYIAPEAFFPGMEIDGRADLYSLGVMLYQMLTGVVPRGVFLPASVQVPGLDRKVDAIVVKAMQADRETRFQNAVEMRAEIDGVLFGTDEIKADVADHADAPLPTLATPGRRWLHDWRFQAALGALIVVAAVALLPLIAYRQTEAPQASQETDTGVLQPAIASGTSSKSSLSAGTPPAPAKPTPATSAPAEANKSTTEDEQWISVLGHIIDGTGGVIRKKEAWKMESGRLVCLQDDRVRLMDQMAQNMAVRVSVRPSANQPPACALYVRRNGPAKQESSYYMGFADLSRGSRIAALGLDDKVSPVNSTRSLGAFYLPSIEGSQEWLIELRAEGNKLTVRLNGDIVTSASDNTLLRPGFAYLMTKPGMSFSRVEYLKLPDSPPSLLAEAAKEKPAPSAPLVPNGENWIDWLAQRRAEGRTPTNWRFESDGVRFGYKGPSMGPDIYFCSQGTMRNGALRITFTTNGNQPPILHARYDTRYYHRASIQRISNLTVGKEVVLTSKTDRLYQTLSTSPDSYSPYTGKHELELRAVEDVVTLRINGTEVLSIKDPAIQAGAWGFSIPDPNILVHKVELLNLPDAPPPATKSSHTE